MLLLLLLLDVLVLGWLIVLSLLCASVQPCAAIVQTRGRCGLDWSSLCTQASHLNHCSNDMCKTRHLMRGPNMGVRN